MQEGTVPTNRKYYADGKRITVYINPGGRRRQFACLESSSGGDDSRVGVVNLDYPAYRIVNICHNVKSSNHILLLF